MGKSIELDFSDVQDLQPFARNVPKGNYVLKVKKIESTTSKNGNPMWVVDSEFVDGPFAGQILRERMALTEKALFKVKGWLESMGFNVGRKKVKLPNTSEDLMKQFGGRTFGAHVDDGDPYVDSNGNERINSEIKFHLKADEVKAQAATTEEAEEAVTEEAPKQESPAKASEETDESTTEDEDEEETTKQKDVADQLASFDLDNL